MTNLVGLDLGIYPDPTKLTDAIYEMVLAYLLSMRLDKTGWYWLNIGQNFKAHCVTEKVIAAVLLSQFWIDNVTATLHSLVTYRTHLRNKPTCATLLTSRRLLSLKPICQESLGVMLHKYACCASGFYTLVESQMEGLLRFAELLQWPYLHETKDYAEIVNHSASLSLDRASACPYLWDWLYGLTLPGNAFAHKIMIALVLASRSMIEFGLAPTPSFGLVLEDRSYWRQSSVLGRVMGGLKDIKAVSGWMGPCPAPRDNNIKGWANIKAPILSHPRSKNLGEESEDVAPMKYMDELEDWSKYVVPEPPAPSKVTSKLLSIELEEQPREAALARHSGNDYKASILFEVDGERVDFMLKFCPVFVTTPPCLEGPHAVHSRQLPDFNNVWKVTDLKNAPDPATQTTAMVIKCNMWRWRSSCEGVVC